MECELNGFSAEMGAYAVHTLNTQHMYATDWDADIFIVAFWFDEPHSDTTTSLVHVLYMKNVWCNK